VDVYVSRATRPSRSVFRLSDRRVPLVHFLDEYTPRSLVRLSRVLRGSGLRVGELARFVQPANKIAVDPSILDGKKSNQDVKLTLPWGPAIRVNVGLVRALLKLRATAQPARPARTASRGAAKSTVGSRNGPPRTRGSGGKPAGSPGQPVGIVHQLDGMMTIFKRPDGTYYLGTDVSHRGLPDYYLENLPKFAEKLVKRSDIKPYVSPSNFDALASLRNVQGRYVGKLHGWTVNIPPRLQKSLAALHDMRPANSQGSQGGSSGDAQTSWRWQKAPEGTSTGWITTDPSSQRKTLVFRDADGVRRAVSVPASQAITQAQRAALQGAALAAYSAHGVRAQPTRPARGARPPPTAPRR